MLRKWRKSEKYRNCKYINISENIPHFSAKKEDFLNRCMHDIFENRSHYSTKEDAHYIHTFRVISTASHYKSVSDGSIIILSKQPQTLFSKIKETQMCSSIGNRIQIPYF